MLRDAIPHVRRCRRDRIIVVSILKSSPTKGILQVTYCSGKASLSRQSTPHSSVPAPSLDVMCRVLLTSSCTTERMSWNVLSSFRGAVPRIQKCFFRHLHRDTISPRESPGTTVCIRKRRPVNASSSCTIVAAPNAARVTRHNEV